MAGRAKGRDENGRKLPWRPPGAAPVTAADSDNAKARARYRQKPDGQRSITLEEARRKGSDRNAIKALEKLAFPVLTPEPKVPNPRLLTDAQLAQLVKDLATADRFDWRANARPEQLQPEQYRNWLVSGGRGGGKTRLGAEAVREWAAESPGGRFAVIAKGSRELRDVCFEGVSGLLSVFPQNRIKDYRKGLGDTYLVLDDGTKIIGYSAESPDAIRGSAFDAIWGDEFAAWPKHLAQDMLDQAWFCLRESKNPRMILTTTPRRVIHMMDLIERAKTDPGIVITKMKTTDNTALTKVALDELYARYGGTHIGRQELEGEMLEDVAGALWTPAMLEASRWEGELPAFRKVIVGVDPSGSATGDATGIVVVAYTGDKRLFVLGCYSTKGLAAERYNAACRAAVRHEAHEIIYESAYGGDNAALGIENQWKHLVQAGEIAGRVPRIKASTIRGDKAVRASPVAALYEQQMNLGIERVFHVPATVTNGVAVLESELISWSVTDRQSPNSLDALVHAARRSMLELGWEGSLGQVSSQRRIEGGWRPF